MGDVHIGPEPLARLMLSLLCEAETDTASEAFRRILAVNSRIVCRRAALVSRRNDFRDPRSSLLPETLRILSSRDSARTFSKLAVVGEAVIGGDRGVAVEETETTDRWCGIPSGPMTTVVFILPFFVTLVLTALGIELNLKVWCMLCELVVLTFALIGAILEGASVNCMCCPREGKGGEAETR